MGTLQPPSPAQKGLVTVPYLVPLPPTIAIARLFLPGGRNRLRQAAATFVKGGVDPRLRRKDQQRQFDAPIQDWRLPDGEWKLSNNESLAMFIRMRSDFRGCNVTRRFIQRVSPYL